jgi:hypothetical protein
VATSLKSHTVPAFVTPMAAQSVAELPEGDDWIYELKLDGSSYSVVVISSQACGNRDDLTLDAGAHDTTGNGFAAHGDAPADRPLFARPSL